MREDRRSDESPRATDPKLILNEFQWKTKIVLLKKRECASWRNFSQFKILCDHGMAKKVFWGRKKALKKRSC